MHAERLSPAAYWAALVDALPALQHCCPDAAQRCLQELQSGSQAAAPSLQAAAAAGIHLDGHGWTEQPDWEACLQPVPSQAAPREPVVWAHGRQGDAALPLHTSFRERVLMPALRPDCRVLLRSRPFPHAGRGSRPSPPILHDTDATLDAPRTLLPKALAGEGATGCCAIVHNLGDHALACPRTGLLARLQVAVDAVGPEGRVVPQHWLANRPTHFREMPFLRSGS